MKFIFHFSKKLLNQHINGWLSQKAFHPATEMFQLDAENVWEIDAGRLWDYTCIIGEYYFLDKDQFSLIAVNANCNRALQYMYNLRLILSNRTVTV